MKILIIGGGGREHAIAWKLANDSCSPVLYCAPGNAGTAQIATNLDIRAEDVDGLVGWARSNRPDLTVVGPEAPLCAGVVDRLDAVGLRVFGPSQAGARLEGSKRYAKQVMQAAGVPTARAAGFTELNEAISYVRAEGAPLVVKADGLAAGKGVTVCDTVEKAEAALHAALAERTFGAAGESVLIEECLVGEEASILALVDGEHVLLLASSQDHKRALDGDQGPNTGGMGAYSPAPVVTEDLLPLIRDDVVQPTVDELNRRGVPFKGVLYAGLMITDAGPKVLEYNVRFGDPEAQCVLSRIDGDLVPLLQACIDGTLNNLDVVWSEEACVCVVMAAGGYPGSYRRGDAISGLTEAGATSGVTVFHAGTGLQGNETVTAGGRVLGVTARGADLNAAVSRAYRAVEQIQWNDVQYRTDIAARAIARIT